ncbi:unnamed protein product [Cuscuta epithymum]|uniref:C2H2-type domain-containing protein n=1 Tax=Cuscuta epithymum TaxID=186058 RepID=A0AAV0DKN6_9ASTE|nr:unnamed protein product [Cuscuta epithymum]
MDQENQETLPLKHFCKLCRKVFPCGRSLGGHMRSHLISDQPETSEKSRNSGPGTEAYVLRENPRKTLKFSGDDDKEAEEEKEDALRQNKVCDECGKVFLSFKALFGHMKSHSQKAVNAFGRPNRKKRSRRAAAKRFQVNLNAADTTTNSSTLTSANSDYEQEEVAMSLIMLSNDVGSSLGTDNFEFLDMIRAEKLKKPKSRGFECCTCNKTFQTYQALGGHRASHNKKTENKNGTFSPPPKKMKVDSHQCPICFKIFSSGQALGGHKRSHFISAELQGKADVEPAQMQQPETRDFFDLNFPAPVEEDEEEEDFLLSFPIYSSVCLSNL